MITKEQFSYIQKTIAENKNRMVSWEVNAVIHATTETRSGEPPQDVAMDVEEIQFWAITLFWWEDEEPTWTHVHDFDTPEEAAAVMAKCLNAASIKSKLHQTALAL